MLAQSLNSQRGPFDVRGERHFMKVFLDAVILVLTRKILVTRASLTQ